MPGEPTTKTTTTPIKETEDEQVYHVREEYLDDQGQSLGVRHYLKTITGNTEEIRWL